MVKAKAKAKGHRAKDDQLVLFEMSSVCGEGIRERESNKKDKKPLKNLLDYEDIS